MAEAKGTSSAGSTAAAAPAAPATPSTTAPKLPSLRQIWPIPALILAVALFAGGLVVAFAKRPKPDPGLPLLQARSLVDTQQFTQAVDFINAEVKPFYDRGLLNPEQTRDYHAALARAFGGALHEPGYGVPFNHQVVVESFQRAERLGAELTPQDVSTLVRSLLALGRTDEAVDRTARLPDSEGARKAALIKAVAEHTLAQGAGGDGKGEQRALELLATLSASPDLPPADRAWVLARQAELLLKAGQPEQAVGKLVRRIGLLQDVPPDRQGELYLLLGKAYFQTDQLPQATRQLEVAESVLPASNPLRAESGLLLGRIAQSRGVYDQARDRYAAVISEFGGSPPAIRALLGLAEVLAAHRESSGDQEASLERYAELAEHVRTAKSAPGVPREVLLASLMQRFDERFKAGLAAEALRFVEVAETIFPDKDVPAPILKGIGECHRSLAETITGGPDFRTDHLDETTRAEAKRELLAAAKYLKRHALSVVATDNAAYAESLWRAADAFDRAGDLEEARKAFNLYADGAADNDPNRPAAKFRLAQVCLAQREYPTAAAILRELHENRGRGDAESPAGRWGQRAVVPLAQCLLQDSDPNNNPEAERLLTQLVEGGALAPDAQEYRDALIELGAMHYAAGRFSDAIERLTQAVERYPDDRRVGTLRYELADSHRLEAGQIRATLEQALPQSQRDELERLRLEHLRTAKSLFERVTTELGAIEPARLLERERVCLRNAYFYIGDCAFDAKDYDSAISAYDAARLRYGDHPASLVAMSQIVSAYIAQNRWTEARTANERAREQLSRFPESVWAGADLPMEKKHWERWLDARTRLEMAGVAGAEGGSK